MPGDPPSFVAVTDRGGHLANALLLFEQMRLEPQAILVARGPEAHSVAATRRTYVLPQLFSWFGQKRVLNPVSTLHHIALALFLAIRLRPRVVLSFGAYSTPVFCYWAWLLGSRIVHIENLNNVDQTSRTGRLLRPICSDVFVQWEELVEQYGDKGRYAGWVL